jgi:hypothetical protein
MNLRGSNGGNKTGSRQIRMQPWRRPWADARWPEWSLVTAAVAIGGDPRWVTPNLLPAPTQLWLESGDEVRDPGVRGSAAATGSDGDGECHRRFVPSFTLQDCPWKRQRFPRVTALEHTTYARHTDP